MSSNSSSVGGVGTTNYGSSDTTTPAPTSGSSGGGGFSLNFSRPGSRTTSAPSSPSKTRESFLQVSCDSVRGCKECEGKVDKGRAQGMKMEREGSEGGERVEGEDGLGQIYRWGRDSKVRRTRNIRVGREGGLQGEICRVGEKEK